MGIGEGGVNTENLSGMLYEQEGLHTCLFYASKSWSFNSETEVRQIEKICQGLLNVVSKNQELARLKIAVLRLLLMGAEKDNYPSLKEMIEKLRDNFKETPIASNWKETAPLVGQVCKKAYLQVIPPEKELQRGQLVVIERDHERTYGMIEVKLSNKFLDKKSEDYHKEFYCVILNHEKGRKDILRENMNIVSEEAWRAELSNYSLSPLAPESKIKFKYVKEELNEILALFDQVQPFDFIPSQLELIEKPFPIVWASLSLTTHPFKRGIEGEQIVKGKALLGEDIQVVFTPKEKVDQLKALAQGAGFKF